MPSAGMPVVTGSVGVGTGAMGDTISPILKRLNALYPPVGQRWGGRGEAKGKNGDGYNG